ncbi:MAG: putative secreted protease [Pseudonocardia sp.]|nr:putative secreted protease [Pseudonocardia sp.]
MQAADFERIFRPQHSSAGPHTLKSPIRYEVWKSYALGDKSHEADLLLEPAGEVGSALLATLGQYASARHQDLAAARPAMIGGLIAIKLRFDAFLEIVVPLTAWRDIIAIGQAFDVAELEQQLKEALTAEVAGASATDRQIALPRELEARLRGNRQDLIDRFRWYILLVTRIGYLDESDEPLDNFTINAERGALRWLKQRFDNAEPPTGTVSIDAVSKNRPATAAVQRSRNTIKADAADRLFDLSCAELGWAVLDSGIDARHPAFRSLDRDGRPEPQPTQLAKSASGVRYRNRTRIVDTYDLTTAREQFAGTTVDELKTMRFEERLLECKIDLFPKKAYIPPKNDHGTHVAGILAANWIRETAASDGRAAELESVLVGVCPDLQLWDIRILDEHGQGDEFSVVAGLRLVELINRRAGRLVIHGVNLSLSITHHAANFACGWTPVCKACSDLVDSGVVVVAAAGNTGFSDPSGSGRADGTNYNDVSITDPGNAEKVITVGATHGTLPHQYGTSYFSARGPTADGRRKPDLLAPGEGITGPIPLVHNNDADYKSYDGTSQAAPHVSGAAALLLGRYPELSGQPERVKQILCSTSTDLGREPYFQGHGLVDVLRALQSL